MDAILKLLPERGKTVIAAMGVALFGVYEAAVELTWISAMPDRFEAALLALLAALGAVGIRHGIEKVR